MPSPTASTLLLIQTGIPPADILSHHGDLPSWFAPLLADMPRQFPAQLTHMQTITRLPEHAVVLATSDHDRFQIVPGVFLLLSHASS